MDAQVIFPSVICQRRIIKPCFVKDNSKHAQESMMKRNSNGTQMTGWSERRGIPVHGNESGFFVVAQHLMASHGKNTTEKIKHGTYIYCDTNIF